MTTLLEALDKVFREQDAKLRERQTIIDEQRVSIERLKAIADERTESIVSLVKAGVSTERR